MLDPQLAIPPSQRAAKQYYYGTFSAPILVARTSTIPWQEVTGPFNSLRRKTVKALGRAAPLLQTMWESVIALALQTLLENELWTSMGVFRIGYDEDSSPPAILWIGVVPGSLSGERGVAVAFKCRELLLANGIVDVHVEIYESTHTRFTIPGHNIHDPTELRHPNATSVGFPISATSAPEIQGTGGLFFTSQNSPGKLFLLTARHVVFSPEANNHLFAWRTGIDQPAHSVTLFNNKSYHSYLTLVRENVSKLWSSIERLQPLSKQKVKGHGEHQSNLLRAQARHRRVKNIRKELLNDWSTSECRVLGEVVLSPPIAVNAGAGGYTCDWAVIEIDSSKVRPWELANGNALDLGTRFSPPDLEDAMTIDGLNPNSFELPEDDGLLRISGAISDQEMRHPTTLDHDGQPCLMVLKRGMTSGLTMGQSNNVQSFIRRYWGRELLPASKEWAIVVAGPKLDRPFSERGDSGSVVVDGLGRIGGMITGGEDGLRLETDITYVTPINFIMSDMEENGLTPNFNNLTLTP